MAVTTGLVQRIAWTTSTVCAWVGPSPTSTELLFVQFKPSDTEIDLAFKLNTANLLAEASVAHYPVSVGHSDTNAEIQDVSFGMFNISPIGQAVHNDFYSVSGSGIPNDVEVVFDSALATVTVAPDFVRPHWVLLAALPDSIPVGLNRVRLQSSGWTSDWVPIQVSASPQSTVRVLYSGQPKDRPYNIVFVANPGIQTTTGAFVADPVLTHRDDYLAVVAYCLRNLMTVTEELLRQGNRDAQIRIVSIFDPTRPANDANSLAHEISPNLMETRRNRLNGFVSGYSEVADIVFVIHGSTTHDRATSWFTTDDGTKAGTAYTYDGAARTHGHFPSIPGSAALPLSMNQTGLTPLHEFGHAGSDFNNGRVIDLYVDGSGGPLAVNKKVRASNTDPVPLNFASYNGANYASDPNRDSLGYGTWVSYHPELIDSAHPNLMDNYWLAPGGNPQVCRLDRLTFAWYTDRLQAKLTR